MTPADILRTATRPIRTRSLESALIVMVVAMAVGVETTMTALVLNGFEQERIVKSSVEARALAIIGTYHDYRTRSFMTGSGVNPVLRVGRPGDNPTELKESDLQDALRACPALDAAFLADFDGVKAPKGDTNASQINQMLTLAITPSYIQAANLKLLVGAWPTSNEFKNRERVLVVTEWFARRWLLQAQQATPSEQGLLKNGFSKKPDSLQRLIGQTVRSAIGGNYKIIGVFATPEQVTITEGFGFTNARQKFGALAVMPWGIGDFSILALNELKFLARAGQFDEAREQLRTYTSKRFGPDISVYAYRDELNSRFNVSRSASLLTAFFASGGMVIAALNITNLMLARVLGRTRGIGISNALGASSGTIFRLFLIESLLLGLVGGLIGLVLAYGITAGLEQVLNGASAFRTNMDLTLQPFHLALGVSFALSVSVFFGAYPAWRASKIRPSEALRG
jgi:ABC-type antimicrobial peptide transport system permease subunit